MLQNVWDELVDAVDDRSAKGIALALSAGIDRAVLRPGRAPAPDPPGRPRPPGGPGDHQRRLVAAGPGRAHRDRRPPGHAGARGLGRASALPPGPGLPGRLPGRPLHRASRPDACCPISMRRCSGSPATRRPTPTSRSPSSPRCARCSRAPGRTPSSRSPWSTGRWTRTASSSQLTCGSATASRSSSRASRRCSTCWRWPASYPWASGTTRRGPSVADVVAAVDAGAKVLFFQPWGQNPSGQSLSDGARRGACRGPGRA